MPKALGQLKIPEDLGVVCPPQAPTCIDDQAVAHVGVAELAASQQDPVAVEGVGLAPPLQRAGEAVHAAVGLLADHSPLSRGTIQLMALGEMRGPSSPLIPRAWPLRRGVQVPSRGDLGFARASPDAVGAYGCLRLGLSWRDTLQEGVQSRNITGLYNRRRYNHNPLHPQNLGVGSLHPMKDHWGKKSRV